MVLIGLVKPSEKIHQLAGVKPSCCHRPRGTYIVFESGHLIGAELQTHQVGARCAQFQGRFLADFYATVVPRDPGGNAKFGKIFGLG